MQAIALDKRDIVALSDSPNPDVIRVLSSDELSAFTQLQPSNLHPDDKAEIQMTLENILSALRAHIFDGAELPAEFPELAIPITPSETSSEIGIVTAETADIEGIKAWVIATLATCNGVSEGVFQRTLEFEARGWFGGPISVRIIPQSEFEETKNSLPLS